jgi:hypothetical protein
MASTPLHIPDLVNRNKFRDYRDGVLGNSYTWWAERDWNTPEYIAIHHSVTNPTNNYKGDVDYIAHLHVNVRSFGGIGYHFVITTDGTVWYVGDISTMRANVANKNHLVIGICLVGDFTKHNPTDDQILSVHDLCKFLKDDVHMLSKINGKSWEQVVVGHKELQATACPGTSWKGPDDSMFERIKNRIPYTPQPQPEPKPEPDNQPLNECLKQVKDLISQLNEKQTEMDEIKKKLLSAENNLENSKKRVKELSDKIEELEESSKKCQSQLKTANTKIAKLEEENQKLVKEKNDNKGYYEKALKYDIRKYKNPMRVIISGFLLYFGKEPLDRGGD